MQVCITSDAFVGSANLTSFLFSIGGLVFFLWTSSTDKTRLRKLSLVVARLAEEGDSLFSQVPSAVPWSSYRLSPALGSSYLRLISLTLITLSTSPLATSLSLVSSLYDPKDLVYYCCLPSYYLARSLAPTQLDSFFSLSTNIVTVIETAVS